MKQYNNPPQKDWPTIAKRPALKKEALDDVVKNILQKVKEQKDQALFELTKQFDGVALKQLAVSELEIATAIEQVPENLKEAIKVAAKNIEKFHRSQQDVSEKIETTKGVFCWRKSVAIESVGLYIPGGTAPLFSTILMLGTPAKIAGCKNIVITTPPNKNGQINPAVLYTAQLIGITKIFKVGGAQAIAAMAYGTESIPQVYKIFGPGNQFVTKAKELVQQTGVAIDMPAGPSEVLVIADENAKPAFVAADLLAQAEHGVDSQVVVVGTEEDLLDKINQEVAKQLAQLPRADIAAKALENSLSILFPDMEDCLAFSNAYAPEHLIIASETAANYVDSISNAGSVFLGNYSCESAGDYASGTNHTLPTQGFARNYSGVSLDGFYKKITFQEITRGGLEELGPSIELMAEAEGLSGHARSVSIRTGLRSEQAKLCQFEKGIPVKELVRENIKSLIPYSSARSEFVGAAEVFLDANENPFGTLNRYPDPYQSQIKEKLSKLKGVATENIFLGNGSDEIIDLAFRIFCNPGRDKALTFAPTYGMYEVSAAINEVALVKIPLTKAFQVNKEAFINETEKSSYKVCFLCSPNNPTGNCFDEDDIRFVIENFSGLVIIDEAYIDFSTQKSWLSNIENYENLLVMQTFSKAWGLAGVRVGMAYGNSALLSFFNKVKPPYNISTLNQTAVLEALDSVVGFEKNRATILSERDKLIQSLEQSEVVNKVFPSDANFLLVEIKNADRVYEFLVAKGIIVRNRNRLVENCLRITVGTEKENALLLAGLEECTLNLKDG